MSLHRPAGHSQHQAYRLSQSESQQQQMQEEGQQPAHPDEEMEAAGNPLMRSANPSPGQLAFTANPTQLGSLAFGATNGAFTQLGQQYTQQYTQQQQQQFGQLHTQQFTEILNVATERAVEFGRLLQSGIPAKKARYPSFYVGADRQLPRNAGENCVSVNAGRGELSQHALT